MKGRLTMSSNNKNLHLTDQDRIIIEKGIENIDSLTKDELVAIIKNQ